MGIGPRVQGMTARPASITCACGAKRLVPKIGGRVPDKCFDCQAKDEAEKKRTRARERARRIAQEKRNRGTA